MRSTAGRFAVPLAILALTAGGLLAAAKSDGYTPFVLALVALTAVVGVGLNILLGLTGQVSLGHVGFYAIGAYTVAILTLKGVDFWIAWPLAGAIAGVVGFAAGAARAARHRTLSGHGDHRFCLHRSASARSSGGRSPAVPTASWASRRRRSAR